MPLSGLRILLLEDEFLIAMDVEQLCRDNGAENVITIANLRDASRAELGGGAIDVAIVDLMLGGESTLDFAETLKAAGVPFLFASGYHDFEDVRRRFPDTPVVGKPYSGADLIAAVRKVRGI